MTKAEILALPLDKLNELVAEKVMGECLDFPDGEQNYSGRIVAAWRVVEKMDKLGFAIQLNHWHYWSSIFWKRDDPRLGIRFDECVAAPEVICRAALLALEGKE